MTPANSSSPSPTSPASPTPPTAPAKRALTAVILAAGQSKRMASDLVKVLHPVADRPMVAWVIDACLQAGCESVYLVVGHQADKVRTAFGKERCVHFVEQLERLGTGHAVMQTSEALAEFEGDVFVLAGDGPLIRAATLRKLLEAHRKSGAAATLATAVVDDPAGYGRIVRDGQGRFQAIVEHKDASEAQRAIREINPSYYCFRAESLFAALGKLTNKNASGEYYLTDALEILLKTGHAVEVVSVVESGDVLSINTQEQLAQVDTLLRARLRKESAA